jgi:hypothetical protein
MEEIEPGFDPLISVCRELPTGHGPVDNLFMTPTGDIVILEAKLWRNPQARREVVAQALDYASCLFEMTYGEFERAALAADLGDRPRPKSLYELVVERGGVPEMTFVDAVSFNLRWGRLVVLVAGDGIRSETERLAASLQSHAGFHFTFALVELAVYRVPGEGDLIVVPRTLAKTTMIERGIVRIHEGRPAIGAPGTAPSPSRPFAGNITAEQFYDAMRLRDPHLPEALRGFIEKVKPLGVFPEFRRSLMLRFEAPDSSILSLGTIYRNGEVWTDSVHNSAVPVSLSRDYIEELARAWDLEIDRNGLGGRWTVRQNGVAPRIETMVARLDAWSSAIEHFIAGLRITAEDTSAGR